ncbi:MAG: arylsulfatase [Halobacteriales archaeon]
MPSDRPNVILVLTDDQGYGDVSAHGNPVLETPTIDRLGEESVRFTDYHVEPMCTPTRGELMTGRDALVNGATFVCQGRRMMREDLPTLPDCFADNGYRTGHFGKWHLGDSYPHRPQDRGFHETVHHGGWGITSIADYWGNDYCDDTYRHNDALEDYEGYCTDVWFEEAMAWMEEVHAAGEPFFCYLPTNCPHTPHWVDEEYSEPYESAVDEDVLARFFGQIENIDDNLDRLMRWLEETGLDEETILIFMTDNGTVQGHEVFNAGMRGNKTSLYEGGHRVPFYVRWPGGDLGPGEVDALTHGPDLFPTLIDLCDLDAPEEATFDGRSLAGLLRDGERQGGSGESDNLDDRTLVVQYGPDPEKWEAAVMRGPWRLVEGEELYDLRTDPGQEDDVSDEHPGVVAALREDYEDWWAEAIEAFETTKYAHLGSEAANPVTLYSGDWKGDYADNFNNLAAGDRTGYWDVVVETAGEYTFELARWPFEAETALTAGIEGPQGEAEGIPIAEARLSVGDVDVSATVEADDTKATFTVDLEAGETRVETLFCDADGSELCGAYQTRVTRE